MSARRLATDILPATLIGGGILVALVLYPLWRGAVDRNQDARADPHHIAGNLYFVGAPDVAAFLIIGPDGDALIGSSHRGRAHKIVDNVEQLGFEMRDVRILLATDPHHDEAGGLFELQQASGAELWASDANAAVLARGGKGDPSVLALPFRILTHLGVGDLDYSPPTVHHRVQDGDTVRLGPLAFTAHLTPGHSPGCTTWTFTVRDRDRDVHVVHRCSLGLPAGASLVEPEQYPGIRADVEHSLRTLRSLPVDVWLTARGVEYGRYRKYQASLAAADPLTPFIDPEGYQHAIDEAEATFHRRLAEQPRGPGPSQ